jgi:hypothetical protein
MQCVDDTFTVEVDKRSLARFSLEGVTECHAPELGLELLAAKAQVRILGANAPCVD